MSDVKPLLSICIPTYNRCNFLKKSLIAVLNAANDYNEIVEVIVSDNNSTDDTAAFIGSLLSRFSNLHYYINETNIGVNRNIFRLTDEYASGRYCWIIGDDDVIIKSAFSFLIDVLQGKEPDFVKLNYELNEFNKINDEHIIYEENLMVIDSFSHVIDLDAKPSNLLNTFISASVFLREPFVKYAKNDSYYINNWRNCFEVFPHACIFSSVFYNSNNCIYFCQPAVVACVHEKDWDDKLAKMVTIILPQLYCEFIKTGVNKHDLFNSRKIIVLQCLFAIYKFRTMFDLLYILFFLSSQTLLLIRISISRLLKK